MGRFETAAEFYRYREPYPPEFFAAVSTRLMLSRGTRMLDVGCGPGNLAIGFSPFVGSCTAIDIERAMLELARHLTSEVHAYILFHQRPIQDLDDAPGSFDFVTIGRALHWLPRESTLAVLERVVARNGQIVVCASFAQDSATDGWQSEFKRVRSAWASEREDARYRPDIDEWFASSSFRRVDQISVAFRHRVSLADLVKRALSFSVTSPAVLGDRRLPFEAAVESALTPFTTNGTLDEELIVVANVFARPSD